MSELSPVFTVQVWLDGDDDPSYSEEYVHDMLYNLLRGLAEDKNIMAFTIKVKS
jgi:hypothetical protein